MKKTSSYKKNQKVVRVQDNQSAVDFFRKEIAETRSFIGELSKDRYVEIRSMDKPYTTKRDN